LLGVEERPDKSLNPVGLPAPETLLIDFWNTVNNPQKVSVSILLDKHVRIDTVGGKRIIVIEVPRADRGLRPVYLNQNPLLGTYRRNGEGDYLCTPERVRAMMRDSGEKTQDMLVLDKMQLDVFDYESLHRYRNRMKVAKPGHVWGELEDIEFLQKLGAIGVGEDEKLHPTAAGLLMFGFEYEILHEYPQYFLDYQEHYDTDVRWTDRIVSSSGEWSGNLYDFFFKAYNKLAQNPKIKVPFKLEGILRVDDTPVHKALREALANSLANADYYGERGLVIRNNRDEIIFENPGSFRVTMGEALSGGVSSPRNSVIMKMLNLLDIGERTGSGIPLIYRAWKDEGFENPEYAEQLSPDRSILRLPLSPQTEGNMAIKSGDKAIVATKSGDKTAMRAKSGDKATVRAKSGDKAAMTIGAMKKQAIVDYLAQCGGSKSSALAKLIDVNASRVRGYLNELIVDGIVTAEGENRNRIYRIKG
jgi:predicted HTH transcriptional regulator